MLNTIIYLTSAGPNVQNPKYWGNIAETVYTICSNESNVSYKFYVVVDNDPLEQFVLNLFQNERATQIIKKDLLLEVVNNKKSWATNFNHFFDKYKDEIKYVLISHDDLLVKTEDFLSKGINVIESSLESVGWVSFTNDRYYSYEPFLPIANSFKDPFALDRNNHPCLFECRYFKNNSRISFSHSSDDKKLFDFPTKPVKLHGPYTHLNLISTKALKKIGSCSDWTPYTILMDDDWNLSSLKENFFNVWIPDIVYTHPNPKYNYLRKPGTDLRYAKAAAQKFESKWGFNLEKIDDDVIEYIRKRYENTNIPLSTYRHTYDWDYLKNE